MVMEYICYFYAQKKKTKTKTKRRRNNRGKDGEYNERKVNFIFVKVLQTYFACFS